MARSARGPTVLDGRAATAYVGFWKRVLATLIDTVLALALVVPLVLVARGRFPAAPEPSLVPGPVDLLIELVIPAVLVIACWRRWGATPGKMLVGARIVDERTHGRLTVAQCMLRYAAYLPATLLLGFGILAVAFDRHKQGWHDRIARTVVLSTRPGPES